MQYIILFLEGIITFISPCLLPMLPIYISFFAGEQSDDKKHSALSHSVAFVAGFTTVFVLLGAFAGTLGGLLIRYKTALNIITGMIVVIFGLNFLGILKLGFLNRTRQRGGEIRRHTLPSSFLFGLIFSVGWTPCVGAFLGSALMMASSQGGTVQGILMLLIYSLGLGIPFIISALLIERLKNTFQWIKKHYGVITVISGGFLVVIGISMIFGFMDRLLTLLSI